MAKYTGRVATLDLATPPPLDPSYTDEGVDVSLIRWMLSMSPTERLQVLQSQSDALTALRDAAEQR